MGEEADFPQKVTQEEMVKAEQRKEIVTLLTQALLNFPKRALEPAEEHFLLVC
jgi:hypothetical protein